MRTTIGITTAALALVGAAALPAHAAATSPLTRHAPAAAALHPVPLTPVRVRPATTTPDAATWSAISRAVTGSPLTAAVPASAYVVVDVQRSVHAAHWAAAELEPRSDAVDAARVVLHEVGGTWTLVEVGTWHTGCDVAPRAARRDLQLGC